MKEEIVDIIKIRPPKRRKMLEKLGVTLQPGVMLMVYLNHVYKDPFFSGLTIKDSKEIWSLM